MTGSTHRLVEVGADRLVAFGERFGQRNAVGSDAHVEYCIRGGWLYARGANGTVAQYEVPWQPVDLSRMPLAVLARHVAVPRTLLAVMVRRGGYGAAVLRGGAVVASKHGRKYVQSRTAAGGWSQQRYARRRSNQAASVVGGCLDAIERVTAALQAKGLGLQGVVPGGDAELLTDVLAEMPPPLQALDRTAPWQIPDPRAAVTRELAHRVVGVRVKITEPGPSV